MGHRHLVASLAAAGVLLAAAPAAALAAPAQVALRPAAGPAGTAVVLQGAGFPASRTVLVGARGGAVHAVRTSRAGSFTARLTVPAGRRGAVQIVSSSGRTSVANRFLAAPGATTAGVEVASRRGRVRASPAALLPGGVLVLRGSDLRARAALTVTFVGTSRRVTTSRHGGFAVAIGVPAAQRAGAWPALVAGAGARLAFRLDVLAPAVAARPPVGGSESPAGGTTGTAPGAVAWRRRPRGAAPPLNTAAPTVSGTAAIGRRLTAAPRHLEWDAADRLRVPVAAVHEHRRELRGHRRARPADLHPRVGRRRSHPSRLRDRAQPRGGATVAALAADGGRHPPPPSGLAALWHMDETSGTRHARRGRRSQRDAELRRSWVVRASSAPRSGSAARRYVSVPSAAT